MDKLKHIKHRLTELVEMEVDEHLEAIDACELGEVVDMIKDLAEAIYYCTVTEAMEKGDRGAHAYHHEEDPAKKA